MPVYIVQAVQKSRDGLNSVRVASRWPYDAQDLASAKEFVDATPSFAGWEEVDSFEILTPEGSLLAKRAYDGVACEWTDT